MLLLHVIIISFFLYSIVYIIVSYGALFHIMIYYDILLLHIVKHVSVAYIYIYMVTCMYTYTCRTDYVNLYLSLVRFWHTYVACHRSSQ